MVEAQLELTTIRCPRCAGQLVLRVDAEERGRSVQLLIDTACVVCGTSPWNVSDERLITFTPGAAIAASGDIGAAQARIDALLRRIDSLERDLGSAQRNLERAARDEQRRRTDVEQQLREEISHL